MQFISYGGGWIVVNLIRDDEMKPISIIALLMLPAVSGLVHANSEQKVFGSQRSATTPSRISAAADESDNKHSSETQEKRDIPKKLKPRDEAKRMYDRFNSGDMLYASLLKDSANNGNQWAALHYGYLAHKGRLPGQKEPDYNLAYKAYMKAVKNPDGSLTANHLAAYNIGLLYFYGGGKQAKNGRTALRWFQTASQAYRELKRSETAVFWPASLYTAQILQNGHAGVPADREQARRHWQDAARHRDPAAMHGFAASIYADNPFAAIRQYQSAADRWHVPSMLALARWYANSDKLHQADPAETARWLLVAATADKRYTSYAERVLQHLNAETQQKVRMRAARWIQSKGLSPIKFDYTSPLNEDPNRIY